MEFLKNLFMLLFILMVIVVVHEGGHFIAAKIFGVYCHEFSFGMGPLLWKHKFKETQLSLRALPIGGFVKMAGEVDSKVETKTDDTDIPKERLLTSKPKWQQIIIMLAGIFMNFVLAFVVMIGAYSTMEVTYPEVVNSNRTDIQVGDILVKADDEIISDLTIDFEGKEITIKRGEEKVIQKVDNLDGLEFKTEKLTLSQSIEASFGYCKEVSMMMFNTLKNLFVDEGYKNLGGVISMYNIVGEMASFVEYSAIIAMLSINVGVVNALPLPILDGGRVLLLSIEAIRRKKLSEKTENLVFTISFLALIGLFVLVMALDIMRLTGTL